MKELIIDDMENLLAENDSLNHKNLTLNHELKEIH